MVRAILAGQKTQTRRVVKPSPGMQSTWLDAAQVASVREGYVTGVPGQQMHRHDGSTIKCGWQMLYPGGRGPFGWIRSPYGGPGDRLWVRETWAVSDASEGEINYLADGSTRCFLTEGEPDWWKRWGKRSAGAKWQPSIYMPRWASRLTLAVESIRVERLNDISEADARAEGAAFAAKDAGRETLPESSAEPARSAFRDLWQSINGKRPGCAWTGNPWVWRVEFSRVTP